MALKDIESARWAKMKVLPHWQPLAAHVAIRSVAAKSRYETVSVATSVPWWFIAIVHELEASQSWLGSLAQGDPWNRVSIHVPRGRGPFSSWEAAAIDALRNCAPFAARNKDWTVGGALIEWEDYNGLGYARMGVPSPYLWSGTDQYHSGKYIADGHYDPHAISGQMGCAILMSEMMKLDATVKFMEVPANA
jgi:lysozyme family protein